MVIPLMTENNLASIKERVEENIGKRVILKADRGRKRIVTKEGIILDAFPNIFTVRISNKFNIERTVSYSYSDILTETIELKIC